MSSLYVYSWKTEADDDGTKLLVNLFNFRY